MGLYFAVGIAAMAIQWAIQVFILLARLRESLFERGERLSGRFKMIFKIGAF
jgi:hypothetical protein